jgi:hypothetical protein
MFWLPFPSEDGAIAVGGRSVKRCPTGTLKAKVFGATVPFILAGVALLLTFGPLQADGPNGGKDSITREKEKDRTVYTIGPGDDAKAREESDRTWEMLKGVVVDTRGPSGKRPDNNR